jgi:hypothetical protein
VLALAVASGISSCGDGGGGAGGAPKLLGDFKKNTITQQLSSFIPVGSVIILVYGISVNFHEM